MKTASLNCLLEAYRRWVNRMGSGAGNKPLGEKWLGLGTHTDYKQAVHDRLMEWVNRPQPRCSGWLKLTPLGEDYMREFAARGICRADFDGFRFTAWNKLGNLREL